VEAKTPLSFRVHQYHYYARSHDAVTNHMLMIQSALLEIGISGDIFAHDRDGVSTVREFKADRVWDCDLLIIHFSQGNKALSDLTRLEVPKALVYHNITPSKFLAHDVVQAKLSDLGRLQLKSLQGKVQWVFGDSLFNCRELEQLGFRGASVLALLDLSEPHWNRKINRKLRLSPPWTLLFVGRVVPHKNQAGLIETVQALNASGTQAKLKLVGGGDLLYLKYLKGLVKYLGVQDDVEFLGRVSDEARERLYAESDALVCLSEHEGFCIPIVEAMTHDLIIFAQPKTAVIETLGESGVHLLTDDPVLNAATICTVLKKESVVRDILNSQRQQLERLKAIHDKEKLQKRIETLLMSLRHPPQLRKLSREISYDSNAH